MTEHLRAALSDDRDTPAGVDVEAVRTRAGRLRRGRWAVAGVAALTAVAIAVPVVLLRPDPAPPAPSAPVTAAGQAAPACPDTAPAAPAAPAPATGPLVGFAPTGGLLCGYLADQTTTMADGPLGAVTRLTAAQARALAAVIDAASGPDGELGCTDELALPYTLQFAGAGRLVTLRVQPYGCGEVSDGSRVVLAAKDPAFLAVVKDLPTYAACPPRLNDPRTVFTEPAGDALLPADTVRLVVCGYVDGAPAEEVRTARVVETREARRYVTEFDASPSVDDLACTAERGSPVILVTAVTPTGTKRVVGEVGNCRTLSDGTRSVRNEALVRSLWELTQR